MITPFPKFWNFIFGVCFFFLLGPTVPCAGKNSQMGNFIKQFCWRLEQAVQTQFSFAVFALLILLWIFSISQIFESDFWWVFAIWSNCAALVPAGGGGSGGGFFYCLWKRPAASCLTLYFCRNPRKKRLQTRLPRLETAWETGTNALWSEGSNFVLNFTMKQKVRIIPVA